MRRLAALLVVLLTLSSAASAAAQTVEVAPFGGYRFGGDLYEVYLGRPVDSDGAPSVGLTADVFVNRGTSVSFLYSRQQTRVAFPLTPATGAPDARLSIEHWHLGGTYELDRGPIRPFLAGTVGLTRLGGAHDAEVRFSAAGGGGVKLMPTRHVGVRLDGRAYAVFVDGRLGPVVCGGGTGCLIGLDVFVLWQVEFTAGLVVSF